VDPFGSEYGSVTGSCEFDGEPAGYGPTDLVG
jgi:hypothetical protein